MKGVFDMKGWLFQGTHIAPKLIEKEDPHAVPGEVVIDIKAAGLCHSDVGALELESWMRFFKVPVIFGHECAGEVVEVGEGVTNLKIGDRVGVVPQSPSNPFSIIGYTRDGGYATKCLVPADQCVLLPENVSYVQGAAGTDAGATSYHALFGLGQAKAGMKVGIIGIGGLGQFAAQMAKIEGCTVFAADPSEEARELAEKIGCDKVYKDVREMAEDAPELIVDFAGFDSTVAGAIDIAPMGGTIIIVGGGSDTSTIHINQISPKELVIKGSRGNVFSDVAGVYEYFNTGKLTPNLYEIPFEEIGEGLERLKKGGIRGRLVAVID